MKHGDIVMFDMDLRLLWFGVRLSAGLHASDRMFQLKLKQQRNLF